MSVEDAPIGLSVAKDQVVPLFVTHWLPAGTPRGAVLLAHGYAEHAGRYAHVADRLTAAGYAVYALDHWGHGRSDGTPGFVPMFQTFVDGMAALLARVQAGHPDLPLFLLGHSMGGLISTLLLARYQSRFNAAVLSGPAIVPAAPPSPLLIWISRFLSRFFPRTGVLTLDANGVSRDPDVVAAYLADPLVYKGKISARLGAEMFDAMARARDGASGITLPILIQHGDADSLAAPAGSQFLYDHLGSLDKKLILYPGLFHEIYNEPERERAIGDMIGWFDAHLG